MHVFRLRADRFFLRLELGEEAIDALKTFVKREQIGAAALRGIGAARAAEIAFYNLPEKRYEPIRVEETTEVTSLTGNVGRSEDGDPIIHIHVTLGRRDGTVRGGHLFRLEVGATLEIDLDVFAGTIRRRLVPEIGLPLQCGYE